MLPLRGGCPPHKFTRYLLFEQLASYEAVVRVIKALTVLITCLFTLGEDLDSRLTSCDVRRKKELIDVPVLVLGELLCWVRD